MKIRCQFCDEFKAEHFGGNIFRCEHCYRWFTVPWIQLGIELSKAVA